MHAFLSTEVSFLYKSLFTN